MVRGVFFSKAAASDQEEAPAGAPGQAAAAQFNATLRTTFPANQTGADTPRGRRTRRGHTLAPTHPASAPVSPCGSESECIDEGHRPESSRSAGTFRGRRRGDAEDDPSGLTTNQPATKEEDRHDAMLMSLQIKVEVERQMHSLSMAHFAWWNFWSLFFPSAVLTMASGVLAFLSTSDVTEEDNRTRLVVCVGCLALVATFLQTLNDLLKYGSRADMHSSAVLDLKGIYDALDFMQISRIGSTDHHANVAVYHKIYSQVQQGCKSTIPLCVTQTYNTIETRLANELPNNVNLKCKIHSLNDDLQLALTVWNEVYCAIAAYWLFPIFLPDPDRTMTLVLKRVEHAIDKETLPAAPYPTGLGRTWYYYTHPSERTKLIPANAV